MDIARIAELLDPFLQARIAVPAESDRTNPNFSEGLDRDSPGPAPCYPEPGKSGEEPALSPLQLERISTFIDILIRWNARINLTAIREPEEIVTRHFGESLFAARHLSSAPSSGFASSPARHSAPTFADIGSGAGFPGLPIKLWAPHIALTLIESNSRKAAFLREITRALTLTNVNIQNARAETFPTEAFDVVTLRAVERFESILPTAAALVASSGRLALLIGASQHDQVGRSLPQFTWADAVPIPLARTRILLVGHRR